MPGPSTETMQAAARDANAYVLFPMYEKMQDGELYNTALVIDPNGEIIGKYRKHHIPLVRSRQTPGVERFFFQPRQPRLPGVGRPRSA